MKLDTTGGVRTPLAWDPEAMPADWEAGRGRYFAINRINAGSTWAAFILFLAALLAV